MRFLLLVPVLLLAACTPTSAPAPNAPNPTPNVNATVQTQVRATVAALPTATAQPTAAVIPTATVRTALPTSTPNVTAPPSLNDLLIPIDGQSLLPTSGISGMFDSFADYVPSDPLVAAKIDSTTVHLVASKSQSAAASDIRDARDSAYPSGATTTVIGGVTVLEGWTNDREPPSYYLAWVEDGPTTTIAVSLDTAARANARVDRPAVTQQAKRVASALAGHLRR